ILAVLLILSCTPEPKEKEINLTTLLNEMVDREQITRFPETNYQTLQASSYNRESISPDKPGWFADSDGIGFIRIEENNGKKEWVIMEDEGPGVITKIWAVCFYYGLDNTTGANINFYLDGETTPTISTNFFKLVKGQDFVKAPFADESTRAGNLYFPIPYAKSCKITMDDKVFYNIINYRSYPEGTKVKTFSMEEFEQTVALQQQIGETLINSPEIEGAKGTQIKELTPSDPMVGQLFPEGGAIQQIEIKLSETENLAQALRSVVIRAEFDGEETVWAPVGDFFNNVGKIQPYNMWERTVNEDGTMICRWLMPFKENARISLENLGKESVKAKMTITTGAYEWSENSMHFHATWRMDDPTPTFPLYDWNFLEAQGKGVVVGDEWAVLNPVEGWWGEGDEKIYVDGDFEKNFPSHFGTGTEDYYGWAGGKVPTPADEFSKPFLGNIIVADPNSKGYNVCTRTRVLDAIPFRERIKFDVESSCGKRSKSHFLQYAQTTFWYAVPGVSHNRKPLPEKAASTLPSIADLETLIKRETEKQYAVPHALEAEILNVVEKSNGVAENFANIPEWGELSSGSMKNLWFENQGDYAEFKITEQFEKAELSFSATLGRPCGNFKIYVNGKLKTSQNFYSNHAGMTTPYVDLGECQPINNAFTIRFEYLGEDSRGNSVEGKRALGLDFFIVKSNFFKREN
ncbi:MAG: glycoside hydrolase family 172 protein, partial [Allomuricauda sp.]